MRAGRVEEAAAVAKRIAIDITKCNKTRLNHVNLKKGSKDVWVAVREITCQKTAQALNNHYAAISSDSQYQKPER